MFRLIHFSMAAVVALALFFLLPVFSIAQTAEIESLGNRMIHIEKKLLDAKQKNNLTDYYESFATLKDLYRRYLTETYAYEGILTPQKDMWGITIDWGNKSSDTINKLRAFKELKEIDSLKALGKKPEFVFGVEARTENELSGFYEGITRLGDSLVAKSKLTSAAKYHKQGFDIWKRINDTNSVAYIQKATTAATGLNNAGHYLTAIEILNSVEKLARDKCTNLANLDASVNYKTQAELSKFTADNSFALMLLQLGIAYYNLGQLDAANTKLKEGMKVLEMVPNIRFNDSKLNEVRKSQISEVMQRAYRHNLTLFLVLVLIDQYRLDEAFDLLDKNIKDKNMKYPTEMQYMKMFYRQKMLIYNKKLDFKGYLETLEEAMGLGLDISNSSDLLTSSFEPKTLMQLIDVNLLMTQMMDGEKSKKYINWLQGKSMVFALMGKEDSSKQILDKAFKLANSPELTPDIALGVKFDIAAWASRMGQDEQALTAQKEYFEEQKKFLDPLSKNMADEWSRLAERYLRYMMFHEADSCYRKALDIFKKTSGVNHYDYNGVLQQLSLIAYKKGEYKEAEKLMKEALDKGESYFKVLPVMALACYNRSVPIFLANKQIDKAKKYQQQAAKLIRERFQPNQGIYLTNLRYAIQIADADQITNTKKNTDAILGYTLGWLLGVKQLIEGQITFLPDGEKSQFLETLNNDFAVITSVLSRQGKEGAKYLYDLALLQKGIALADTRSFQQKMNILPKGKAKDAALQLANTMKALNDDKTNLDIRIQLSSKADSLRTFLKNDKDAKQLFANDWIETSYIDIQKRLKPDKIAIEFLDFDYHTTAEAPDKRKYYALVLGKTGIPSVIELFEEKKLQALFDKAAKDEKKSINFVENTLYKNTAISELIWAKLEKTKILRGVKTIHYAPSGLLNRVAFAALRHPTDTGLLSDRYRFVAMNGTRDINLIPEKQLNFAETSVSFFADMQYNTDSTNIAAVYKRQNLPPNQEQTRSLILDSIKCGLPPLTDETPQIERDCKQKGIKTKAFRGADGNEDIFRTMGTEKIPAPSIIHISTHGLYDNADEAVELTPQQSLHRNFIMMSGCERWLCPKRKNAFGDYHDGILTAAEIAQMDLSQTQLVVLSACQTGLGDLKGREGVYGLSRGFKLAGARYTLASLWSVPDSATAVYMKVFYGFLLEGKSIPEAYDLTQAEMKRNYRDKPFMWAAWVLTR